MIKKIVVLFLALMMLWSVESGVAQQEISYEKYGRIAVAVVQADFPSDQVTDYKFEGREIVNQGIVEDRFLFTVQEKGKEFKVRVKIRHSLHHQKLLTLTVEKV